MKNTNIIFSSAEYQKYLSDLEALEKDRIFCKHNLEHFMDVARICYILVLEERIEVSKDMVYTTALLHDLGRVDEYKNGTDHHIASVDIAKKFLEMTSYTEEEGQMILQSIASHRDPSKENDFFKAFYKADKASRMCMTCPSRTLCKWPDEKKNLEIKY